MTMALVSSNDNGAVRARRGASGLKPIFATLRAALAGEISTRVDTPKMKREAAEVGTLLNDLLSKLCGQIEEAEKRNQLNTREIELAAAGLEALVPEGDLLRWNGTTGDPRLRA